MTLHILSDFVSLNIQINAHTHIHTHPNCFQAKEHYIFKVFRRVFLEMKKKKWKKIHSITRGVDGNNKNKHLNKFFTLCRKWKENCDLCVVFVKRFTKESILHGTLSSSCLLFHDDISSLNYFIFLFAYTH